MSPALAAGDLLGIGGGWSLTRQNEPRLLDLAHRLGVSPAFVAHLTDEVEQGMRARESAP